MSNVRSRLAASRFALGFDAPRSAIHLLAKARSGRPSAGGRLIGGSGQAASRACRHALCCSPMALIGRLRAQLVSRHCGGSTECVLRRSPCRLVRSATCGRSSSALSYPSSPCPHAVGARLAGPVVALAVARSGSAHCLHMSTGQAFAPQSFRTRKSVGVLPGPAPNTSIERTSQRPLRALCAAAHVER